MKAGDGTFLAGFVCATLLWCVLSVAWDVVGGPVKRAERRRLRAVEERAIPYIEMGVPASLARDRAERDMMREAVAVFQAAP